MVNKDLVNKLIHSLDSVLTVTQFSEEVKENIRQAISSVLHDMDVVTREEFEAQQQVLQKTRKKIDQLEDRLKQYNSL